MKDFDLRRRVGRCGSRAIAVALALSLASCFTAALWSIDEETKAAAEEADANANANTSHDEDDDEGIGGDWIPGHVFWRVPLTPFALVLDLVTCPYQFFFCRDQDDDREPSFGYPQRSG